MYRILTEDKGDEALEVVENILIQEGLDYTIYRGNGSYEGKKEDSLIIELCTKREHLVEKVGKRIGLANNQECVLIQYIKTNSELIFMEEK